MDIKKLVLIACLLISCLIPASSAINITAEKGETWISYHWEPGYQVFIYIDGIKQTTVANFSDWYLTDINSDEKHQIKLYNSTNSSQLLGSLTVTTLHSQAIIFTLIIVLIIFLIMLLFLKDPIKIILVGGVSASVGLYTSTIAVGYGALTVLPLVILVISAIFVALAFWSIIIEKTRW